MKNNYEFEKHFDPKAFEGDPTNDALYLDLPWHLNEMLKEISDEKDKEKIIQNINSYYDSLNTLLIKHTIDHPRMTEL